MYYKINAQMSLNNRLILFYYMILCRNHILWGILSKHRSRQSPVICSQYGMTMSIAPICLAAVTRLSKAKTPGYPTLMTISSEVSPLLAWKYQSRVCPEPWGTGAAGGIVTVGSWLSR
jgi:hypothetical protein